MDFEKYNMDGTLKEPAVAATGSFDTTWNNIPIPQSAYDAMDEAGKSAFLDAGGKVEGMDTGMSLSQGIGAAVGLGQLALGYGQYDEAKKNNKVNRRAAEFNLSEAKKDRAATDAYRASYGV